jgi:fimbrial chaperone protein
MTKQSILVLALISMTTSAFAGAFEVKPTTVSLDNSRAPGAVSVVNTGGEPVRFQVKAVAWTQNDRGGMALVPTKDVVVYPSLFTIPAGGTQSVRVAVVAERAAKERSYRILIEELPSPRPADERGPSEVRVLTHMGVPVFLAPASAHVAGSVDGVIDARSVHVTAHNQGSVHVRVGTVHVTGTRGGRLAFEKSVAGWYVLPGDNQVYHHALPAGGCAGADELRIEASTERGAWTRTIPCRYAR